MLERLAANAHRLRILVEAALCSFEHMFVLPSGNPALLARGALALDGAGAAGVGRVAMQLLPVLDGGERVLQPLSCRAAIDVLVGQIDEVLLAEAAFRFSARCHRLGQRHRDASLLARQDFGSIKVAAIGNSLELFHLPNCLSLLGHVRKL